MTNDPSLHDWTADEQAAEAMIPLIGRLYRDHGVVPLIFARSLVHLGPVDLVRAHRRGHVPGGSDLPLAPTVLALEALLALDLAPAEIDVGKLVRAWLSEGEGAPITGWIADRAAAYPRKSQVEEHAPRDIVLYGFGRIGRLMARLLVTATGAGDKHRLRAIVVRKKADDELERRANLLRRDSVHGAFEGTVRTLPDENALLINGTKVLLIHANAPEEIDYTAYGIDNAVIVDNTGVWRDRDGLSRHLAGKGVDKVILTAPGKGDVPNIVFGINDETLDDGERCISAASCTTNAIVPVLKVLDDAYGIVSGHIESVHAYTNDQNLIDNYHKKSRRGRGAALNLVITETGAAKAASKALPSLAGKLTANAIRVPTPNVSLAIMQLKLGTTPDLKALNDHLYQVASDSPLQDQIGWQTMVDTVSTDLVGDTHASTVDLTATVVHDDHVVLYAWYDNEFGYSCQVMRLLEKVVGIRRPSYP